VKPGVNLWSRVLIYNRPTRQREREKERERERERALLRIVITVIKIIKFL